MRNADTILGIIRDRGQRGVPLEDIYRQLYNPSLYLLAYARLYANKGAMTRGITSETVDAMSLRKIGQIIDALRHERYRWTPVRRTYVPKKNGKLRPLGLPTWTDKLLQEVIRLILDAYYEPQFSPHSHGFRPDRGCHTALSEVEQTWTGTKWFIEGDIRACFDRLDKDILVGILRERLHDNRFIRLIQQLLDAGYLEDWRYHPTLSGCPQGGVCSPVLSNVYLDRLDTYVAEHLLPAYTRGDKRQRSLLYNTLRVREQYHRKQGHRAQAQALRRQRQGLPERDPCDPHYRRLRYVRYADLCGHRHKSAYAACRVMPTPVAEPGGAAPDGPDGQRGAVGITPSVALRACRGTRAGCPGRRSDRAGCPGARCGRARVP